MAKAGALISALCILAFATIAYSHTEIFDVHGVVNCDPCKFGFPHMLELPLPGATVELTCKNMGNGTVTFTKKATTDNSGKYIVNVKHDHQDDVCEVKLVSSAKPECSTPVTETARIELTENSGIHTDVRMANELRFMTKDPITGCKKLLQNLDLDPQEVETLNLNHDEIAKLI